MVIKAFAGVALISLLPCIGTCQPGASRPTFDAADVRVTSARYDQTADGSHRMQGGFLNRDQYEVRKATMLDLVRTAYNVAADKVVGGPSWLDYDRFDVLAKTRPGTRPERLRVMLQALLADRFHLVVRAETRQVPGYVLSMGKRELRLKAAVSGVKSAGCLMQDRVFEGEVVNAVIRCGNVTMAEFAEALAQLVAEPLQNLPVVDSTSLPGGWDFEFRYSQRLNSSTDGGVLDGIDKLGLKLKLGNVPEPVLIVESVDRQPSPNSPNLAAAMPRPPAPEFEVASIKPCNGPSKPALLRFLPGGRVNATCMDLTYLIRQAWNLPSFGELVGAPKWLTANPNRVTIDARAPAGIAAKPQLNEQARDLLDEMLRSLLIDRYKMKVHYEDRPVAAPTLIAGKPKLTRADPVNRTGCSREQQVMLGPAIFRLVCRNMTMAQFAEQIPGFDITLFYPVLDATGINGAWDFTINYDAVKSFSANAPQPDVGFPAASDPSGSLSFAETIEKQLGLKLSTEKRLMPVLVIDHIEPKPAEN
jgi:uncharacterized protein (TIGR03435 family)